MPWWGWILIAWLPAGFVYSLLHAALVRRGERHLDEERRRWIVDQCMTRR